MYAWRHVIGRVRCKRRCARGRAGRRSEREKYGPNTRTQQYYLRMAKAV